MEKQKGGGRGATCASEGPKPATCAPGKPATCAPGKPARRAPGALAAGVVAALALEDRTSPYSDDKIGALLNVSAASVAQVRARLEIPASTLRRAGSAGWGPIPGGGFAHCRRCGVSFQLHRGEAGLLCPRSGHWVPVSTVRRPPDLVPRRTRHHDEPRNGRREPVRLDPALTAMLTAGL